MNKPLSGQRILITRDSTQAGSLQDQLTLMGAKCLCIPTITLGPPPDFAPFDQAAKTPEFTWVVFTSVNAAIKSFQRLKELKLGLEPFKKLKIACVGAQTARAITDAGLKVDLVPSDFQAEALALALGKNDLQGVKIWHPRALEARDLLGQALTKLGAELIVTPIYQNRLPRETAPKLNQSLAQGGIDWVSFTSSSTAVNFFQLCEPNNVKNLPKLASIGKVTTQTLLDLGHPPTITASPQTLDGLCRAMADFSTR